MNTPSTLTLFPRITTHIALLLCFVAVSLNNTAFAAIPDSAQAARVVHVIDGDTIIVEIQKRREHVRLIGIDTPEARPNHRAELQAHDRHTDQKTIIELGLRASAHTRELLPKKSTVFLEFDVTKRDKYQRLLAYAWIQRSSPPHDRMVNEEILKAGYAYLLTIAPNVKYRARLADAFNESRRAKRGLWQ